MKTIQFTLILHYRTYIIKLELELEINSAIEQI
jgi:hypothetical protein